MTKLLQAERSRKISQTECGYLQFFKTNLLCATFQKSNSECTALSPEHVPKPQKL